MRTLNFIRIYEERLIQIDAKLEELLKEEKKEDYCELLTEKRSIENYLKEKVIEKTG